MMQQQQNMPWINIRLTEDAMNHLRNAIDNPPSQVIDAKKNLAGNISKSIYIKDKDDWFYKNVLKEATEYMYFKYSWRNYFEIVIAKSQPLPIFELNALWVNYQKQYEFNPSHIHAGLYTFVIFMKIPTHWKEQHALPMSANSKAPVASDFAFAWPEEGQSNRILKQNFPLSSEDEGRMLFFPASLQHEVFPFYETEEERITISGNIIGQGELDANERVLEDMEKQVKSLKEAIRCKKERKQ